MYYSMVLSLSIKCTYKYTHYTSMLYSISYMCIYMCNYICIYIYIWRNKITKIKFAFCISEYIVIFACQHMLTFLRAFWSLKWLQGGERGKPTKDKLIPASERFGNLRQTLSLKARTQHEVEHRRIDSMFLQEAYRSPVSLLNYAANILNLVRRLEMCPESIEDKSQLREKQGTC